MLNQLARFAPVVALVEEAAGDTLLDVGSGSGGIAPLVPPRWRVSACDLDFSDYGATGHSVSRARRVRGSVLDLPFADRAFDVVVAVDLIEHVAPGDRPRALAELARVAERRVVVACPCGPAALASDRRLAGVYRRLRRPVPPWLAEHLTHGFPEAGELTEGLDPYGRVSLRHNEWIPAHLAVSALEAVPYLDLVSGRLAGVLAAGATARGGRGARWARGVLTALRGGDRTPAYRTVAVLDRPG